MDGAPREKLEWILKSQERLKAISPVSGIARKSGVTADHFRDAHYALNQPVVLVDGMKTWPAVTRWTPDYLKSMVGSAPVEVQSDRSADPDYERNMHHHRRTMPFDAFIDGIGAAGPGNDLYLTAYNSARNLQALAPLNRDLGFFDQILERNVDQPHGMLWIGPAGTFTPLHHDLTNNLLVQVVGKKRVILLSPGETPRLYNDHHVYSLIRDITVPGLVRQFPRLEGARVHQVILEPGEALFIPLGWWHQVQAQDFSVSITHTNFRWPNDFHAGHPEWKGWTMPEKWT